MKIDLESAQPVIQVDTSEPKVGTWSDHFSVPYVRQALPTGDFSLCGCQDLIVIERKTLDDLIKCLSHDRTRFEDELKRAQRIPVFHVIVESTYTDLRQGRYRSKMTPQSAWGSVIALQQSYRIPFFFGESPKVAAKLCEGILVRWFREHQKALTAAMRGARLAASSEGEQRMGGNSR
ncbi:MAG: ERCC4 domain-containing protein [Thermodesulfobacteriota bacterium]